MLRASGTKGYTRSSTRGYAGVPSCCIHSWTEGRRGGQRCAPSYGPRAENIKPRNGCARFPASGRFGPPACSHGCKPRTDFVANGNSGLTVGWALRPATVRNIATYADHDGNVTKKPQSTWSQSESQPRDERDLPGSSYPSQLWGGAIPRLRWSVIPNVRFSLLATAPKRCQLCGKCCRARPHATRIAPGRAPTYRCNRYHSSAIEKDRLHSD